MKRILVFLLAATMILGMIAICSSANDLNEPVEYRDDTGEIIPFTNYKGETITSQGGKVPKIVGYDVTIDGKKENFYNQGLVANIGNLFQNTDIPVSGTAYFVYDDNNLYMFVECNDDQFFNIMDYVTICPDCGKQRGQYSGCEHMAEGEHDPCNLWDDDCIEFLIDWSNDGSVPTQYRISRSGTMSRDYDTFNTGFSGRGYDVGGKSWGAEFSIPLDSSAIGTELGVHVMIHSMNTIDPYNETYATISNYNATGADAWGADYYDYIILDQPLPTLDTETEEQGGSVIEPPTGGNNEDKDTTGTTATTPNGDKNTTSTTATTTPGGNDKPNPNTADPIVYIILAAVVSLGAAVVVKKTCFNK